MPAVHSKCSLPEEEEFQNLRRQKRARQQRDRRERIALLAANNRFNIPLSDIQEHYINSTLDPRNFITSIVIKERHRLLAYECDKNR